MPKLMPNTIPNYIPNHIPTYIPVKRSIMSVFHAYINYWL